MSTLKVNSLQTTSGAGLYPLKAWVSFGGVGTVSVLSSGNVSSVTDVGVGRYTTNFSSSLSSSNYATSFDNTSYHYLNVSINTCLEGGSNGTAVTLKTTSSVRQTVGTNGVNYDTGHQSVVVAQ